MDMTASLDVTDSRASFASHGRLSSDFGATEDTDDAFDKLAFGAVHRALDEACSTSGAAGSDALLRASTASLTSRVRAGAARCGGLGLVVKGVHLHDRLEQGV